MCNGKGWDIAFYEEDEITVEQHFCRVFGDCGHIDNTLEEAAKEVAKYYRENAYVYLRESAMWENLTHPSYLYYSGKESREGDPL